jgi:hypothetical protein
MGTVVLFCDMQVTQERCSQGEVNKSLLAVCALGLTAFSHDRSDFDKIISIVRSRPRCAKKQKGDRQPNAGLRGGGCR